MNMRSWRLFAAAPSVPAGKHLLDTLMGHVEEFRGIPERQPGLLGEVPGGPREGIRRLSLSPQAPLSDAPS